MKRAAIIGCGTIFQVHLPIIVANPEIELCAVCDNNPAVQEKLPAAAKAVPFYTDYEELLEKEHPDVVHLCLPHYLHVPVSEYFASHGVNVFCEKPVGLNTAQAKEFVEFEAAHPEVKIGICLQNRLNRTTVELKKIIDGGEYGKVIGCRGFVPWFRGKAYYDEQPWRGQLETAGGGLGHGGACHQHIVAATAAPDAHPRRRALIAPSGTTLHLQFTTWPPTEY